MRRLYRCRGGKLAGDGDGGAAVGAELLGIADRGAALGAEAAGGGRGQPVVGVGGWSGHVCAWCFEGRAGGGLILLRFVFAARGAAELADALAERAAQVGRLAGAEQQDDDD